MSLRRPLLEIQLLVEVGRLRLQRGAVVPDLADERWVLDDPPAAAWFARAIDIGWARDPFDRLLAAHAMLRNWRLATGDGELAERLGPDRTLQL